MGPASHGLKWLAVGVELFFSKPGARQSPGEPEEIYGQKANTVCGGRPLVNFSKTLQNICITFGPSKLSSKNIVSLRFWLAFTSPVQWAFFPLFTLVCIALHFRNQLSKRSLPIGRDYSFPLLTFQKSVGLKKGWNLSS